MKTVTLVRWSQSMKATYGRLSVDGESWLTVERSALDVSHPCIPVGTYPVVWDFYHKGQYAVYEIRDVPGRSRILIHGANRPSDLEGCVAPGMSLEIFGGEIGVTSSRAALAEFHKVMNQEPATLIVTEAWEAA